MLSATSSPRMLHVPGPDTEPLGRKFLPMSLRVVRPDGSCEPIDARLTGPTTYSYWITDLRLATGVDDGRYTPTIRWLPDVDAEGLPCLSAVNIEIVALVSGDGVQSHVIEADLYGAIYVLCEKCGGEGTYPKTRLSPSGIRRSANDFAQRHANCEEGWD